MPEPTNEQIRIALAEANRANWKDVHDYCGHYMVSDSGLVYSVKRRLHLKPMPARGGYLAVCLWKHNKCRRPTIHSLVLTAFVGIRPPNHVCNHKNGIKTDNRLCNLEWVTQSDNMRHAYQLGLSKPIHVCGEQHGQSKLTTKQVRDMRQKHRLGTSAYRLAKDYGVTHKTAHRVVTYETWAHV